MKRLTLCFKHVCSVSTSSTVGALSLLALALGMQSGNAATTAVPTTSSANVMSSLMEQFVLDRSVGLPGKVAVRFDKAMLQALPACAVPELFLPGNARLWGRFSVGVRCNAAQPWVRYVSANVSVIGVHYVAAQPIAAGQTLSLADVEAREGDLTALPASVLVDAAQIDGMVASNRIAAGAPLRRELLRAPVIVQQGQVVKVLTQGAGFLVSTEGRAMTRAAAGALLQVRILGGGVISGIVRADGMVERSL